MSGGEATTAAMLAAFPILLSRKLRENETAARKLSDAECYAQAAEEAAKAGEAFYRQWASRR